MYSTLGNNGDYKITPKYPKAKLEVEKQFSTKNLNMNPQLEA